jgi:hypothetical protein
MPVLQVDLRCRPSGRDEDEFVFDPRGVRPLSHVVRPNTRHCTTRDTISSRFKEREP